MVSQCEWRCCEGYTDVYLTPALHSLERDSGIVGLEGDYAIRLPTGGVPTGGVHGWYTRVHVAACSHLKSNDLRRFIYT